MIYSYKIYKGLEQSVEFKGLVGRFIWWLGAAIVLQLLLFALLYLLHVALWFCVMQTLVSGTTSYIYLSRLSKKYGEVGWIKKGCRVFIPKRIKGMYFSCSH
jgi:hypothetical protein